MRYLPLLLSACACDAGTRQRNDVYVPHEVGPSFYVSHSDRGHFVLGGEALLDKIGFGRTSPTRSSEVDSDLWQLVRAYCRPCTVPGDSKPIDEMFPTAYLPDAVAAGCFSLTLADGRIVYGDLRSRFNLSTSVTRLALASDDLLTRLRRIQSVIITSDAQDVEHWRLAERVVNERLLVGLRKEEIERKLGPGEACNSPWACDEGLGSEDWYYEIGRLPPTHVGGVPMLFIDFDETGTCIGSRVMHGQ